MIIQTLKALTADQSQQIDTLWNEEYPLSLNNRFGILLDGATWFTHYIISDEEERIKAWSVIFEKDGEIRFSIIVNSRYQKQGLGKALIEKLKDEHGVFYGWVIDNDSAQKQDGTFYVSPLKFYQQLGFEVLTNERIDSDMLRAVKIKRNPTVFIETERLLLRELLATDAVAMFEMDSNPEVHRYLGNAPVQSIEEIEKVIQFVRGQYKTNGIGRWAVINKENNEFIGWAGFKYLTEAQNNVQFVYDLGYRFSQKQWGRGYATEASIALMNYAKKEMQLDKVYASAHFENAASNRILQKLGFIKTGDFLYENEPQNWYEYSMK